MFYSERDSKLRLQQRAADLFKLLLSKCERVSKRLAVQHSELELCADKDRQRLYGDLLSANLYRIKSGDSSAEVEDYTDEAMPVVSIPLDPRLTPAKNAQKYYAEYRKLCTAEEKLAEQLAIGRDDLAYLESVFDSLTRAENEDDIMLLRQELTEQGYLRPRTRKAQKPRELPPHETEIDGFQVLIGRNNKQNDKLTLKTAEKWDIWLHTKNIPGAHTIIVTEGKSVPDSVIIAAAELAAKNSKASGSKQIPVDYCEVRYVKKPAGAKPGMVIFTHNKTVFVDAAK